MLQKTGIGLRKLVQQPVQQEDETSMISFTAALQSVTLSKDKKPFFSSPFYCLDLFIMTINVQNFHPLFIQLCGKNATGHIAEKIL